MMAGEYYLENIINATSIPCVTTKEVSLILLITMPRAYRTTFFKSDLKHFGLVNAQELAAVKE